MPFKKILRIGQHEEDEEIDDDGTEEKQVKILFPGSRIPATHISPELARELTGKPLEFRMKIRSKITGVDLPKLKIKK
jgi:hypothetical protein